MASEVENVMLERDASEGRSSSHDLCTMRDVLEYAKIEFQPEMQSGMNHMACDMRISLCIDNLKKKSKMSDIGPVESI